MLVEENLAERANRLGTVFREGVLAIKSPLVQSVRGRGLLNAVVIDESKSSKGRTAWQLCLLLAQRGLLAKPTHVNMYVVYLFGYLVLIRFSIRFAPPLVIEEAELQKAIQIIAGALKDLDEVNSGRRTFTVHRTHAC